MSGTVVATDENGVHREEYQYEPYWTLITTKSRILQSKCSSPFICNKIREQLGKSTANNDLPSPDEELNNTHQKLAELNGKVCTLCLYEETLGLPALPDMTFSNNSLTIRHKDSGLVIKFNAFEALAGVDKRRDPLQVADASDWQRSRSDFPFSRLCKKPFDWTFTTRFKGLINIEKDDGSIGDVNVEPTQERIDMELLQRREEILFYDEIELFEDELGDCGVSKLSVKVRVMKSALYVLQRYFLRVDKVLIRINDTRLFYKSGTNYLLREFTNRECDINILGPIPNATLVDPNKLATIVPLKEQLTEKIIIPMN